MCKPWVLVLILTSTLPHQRDVYGDPTINEAGKWGFELHLAPMGAVPGITGMPARPFTEQRWLRQSPCVQPPVQSTQRNEDQRDALSPLQWVLAIYLPDKGAFGEKRRNSHQGVQDKCGF